MYEPASAHYGASAYAKPVTPLRQSTKSASYASPVKSAAQATTTTTTTEPSAQKLPEVIQDRHSTRRYLKGKFLGKGGFAKCYLLTDLETNKLYAGKVVAKASLSKHRAKEKVRPCLQRLFSSLILTVANFVC